MDRDRELLRHFLAAIAYRTQKALRGAECAISAEQLLQGPFADTMTHVGQLAMLRRLADSPVAPENFIYADIRADRLSAEPPPPARPDTHWPDAPK